MELYRKTPWDKEVFGLETCEIVTHDSNLSQALAYCEREFDYVYGRVSCSDRESRKTYAQHGFIACEISAIAKLSRLQKIQLKPLRRDNLCFEHITGEKLFEKIPSLSENMYKYSRFHESPCVATSEADARMQKWLKQLVDNRHDCLGLIRKSTDGEEGLIGYMFFTLKGTTVDLLLGGVVPGQELFALRLWQETIRFFQSNGARTVKARISMSNHGVVDLYQSLGFTLSDYSVDYQKLRS